MDLLARGQPRLANRTLNAWFIHRGRAHWPDTLDSLQALPLYLLLRAEIRAKTEARRPGGSAAAQRYLSLAKTVAAPRAARLIAIGGLSGTGKSSLAKELAWRAGAGAGAIHLRSDEVRKRLHSVPMSERLPKAAYTQELSDRVYGELCALAGRALTAGQTVVLDAVFGRESERTTVAAIAAELGVKFDGLWLEAPVPILEQRLALRRGDVSDANVAVLHSQMKYDLGRIDWQRIDVSGGAAGILSVALEYLGLV